MSKIKIMAAGVTVDFDRRYDIDDISKDLRNSLFRTELQDGSTTPLKVEISNESHELIPDVYNLAFGPLDHRGRIDDKAELRHADYSKVFSTILLTAYTYLKSNPSHYLGIDGSDNRRAILYFRMLQRNYEYLSRYFNIYGLKYYVRITRFGKRQYDNPFDFTDIEPYPEEITKSMKISPELMYNYFIFNLQERSN
jgi:hypothetical protein